MGIQIVDYHEDRNERCWHFALSCGCNVTLSFTLYLHDFVRALIDLQRNHTCEAPE